MLSTYFSNSNNTLRLIVIFLTESDKTIRLLDKNTEQTVPKTPSIKAVKPFPIYYLKKNISHGMRCASSLRQLRG